MVCETSPTKKREQNTSKLFFDETIYNNLKIIDIDLLLDQEIIGCICDAVKINDEYYVIVKCSQKYRVKIFCKEVVMNQLKENAGKGVSILNSKKGLLIRLNEKTIGEKSDAI